MNFFVFLGQVKAEASRVIWPTRREVSLTSVVVLVMTVIISLFLLFVDQVIGWFMSGILSISF